MSSKPNIVVMISHDSGCHFGCYGAKTVCTPHIDSLAASGLRLAQCFASAPICSPSRGSLFTGQWPQRNGMMGLAGGKPGGAFGWDLNRPTEHLSHILHNQGYETVLFGHQHDASDVTTLGFDHVGAYMSSDTTAPEIGSSCRDFLRERQQGEAPLYLQVGFFETHTPYDHGGVSPDSHLGTAFPEWSEVPELDEVQQAHAAGYQGSVASLDRGIGLILEGLRESGMEENTILLFTVDHGPEFPLGKWSVYDGGLQVAAILRWPAGGWTGGRVIEPMVANVDLMPTMLEAAGLTIPEGLDGKKFCKLLAGKENDGRDAVFGMFVGQRFCVRTDTRLLICNCMGSLHESHPEEPRDTNPALELYDLVADPHVSQNRAYDPAWLEERQHLATLLADWLRSANDPVLRGIVTGPGPMVVPADARWHAGVGQILKDAEA